MSHSDAAPNFKQAFCTYFKCAPEQYVPRALFYSFYRRSFFAARVLYLFRPISIRVAIQSIETLGEARLRDEVVWVMDDYRYQLRISQVNSLVNLLRIRLSGRRVLELHGKLQPLLGISSEPSPPPAPRPRFDTSLEVAPVRTSD